LIVLNFDQTPNACPIQKTQPALRETERPPSPQAVGERGRDENLEKGAASQLLITTQVDVCFRKICQRDFLTCRSSRSMSRTLQSPKPAKKHQKQQFYQVNSPIAQ
jgi:hypothetical protein